MITVEYFYFFEGSGDHRDLHSFPARRSSDVAAGRWRSVGESCPRVYGRRPCGRTRRMPGSGHAATSTARSSSTPARSEEHTSELQSRQYLVCRLLLEKNHTSDHRCPRRLARV